jgi:hypothetical protein
MCSASSSSQARSTSSPGCSGNPCQTQRSRRRYADALAARIAGIASAGANRHDSPLLAPTLQAAADQLGGALPDKRTCHLDAGYDSQPARQTLSELANTGQIAHKGTPAPIQVGRRWPVERTHSWMNGYGKLRRMTDRNVKIVEFYLYLAAAFVTVRQFIQRARRGYRWDIRPATKRLK